jgi:hypothetical protein
MSKFKVGDRVKVKDRKALIAGTKTYFNRADFLWFIENGGLNDYIKHCGKTSTITRIEYGDIYLNTIEGVTWFEEDLTNPDEQFELNFD